MARATQGPQVKRAASIHHARRKVAKLSDEGCSLQDHPACYLTTAYQHAREDAAVETGLPLATFPEACPWAVEQVLAEDFWPEA